MNEQEVYCAQETENGLGSAVKTKSREFPEALWLEQEPSSRRIAGNSRNWFPSDCSFISSWGTQAALGEALQQAYLPPRMAWVVAFAEVLEGADWKLRLFSSPCTQCYGENPLRSWGLEVEHVSVNAGGNRPMDWMVGRYSHYLVVGVESEKMVSEALYRVNKEGQLPPEQI